MNKMKKQATTYFLIILLLSICNTSFTSPYFNEQDNQVIPLEIMRSKMTDISLYRSGSFADVYSLDHDTVLRVRVSQRKQRSDYLIMIAKKLRSLKEQNQNLPIANIYSIFQIDTHSCYFDHNFLKPEANDKFPNGKFVSQRIVMSNAYVMEKVLLYQNRPNEWGEPWPKDYELAKLYILYNQITPHDEDKLRNLGYILQEEPVSYTFVFNNGATNTYEIIDQPNADGLYRKTIFLDYDYWKTDQPHMDDERLKAELQQLINEGIIQEKIDPTMPQQLQLQKKLQTSSLQS